MKKLLSLAVLAVSLLGASSASVYAGFYGNPDGDNRQDYFTICLHTFHTKDGSYTLPMWVNIESRWGHAMHGDTCFS